MVCSLSLATTSVIEQKNYVKNCITLHGLRAFFYLQQPVMNNVTFDASDSFLQYLIITNFNYYTSLTDVNIINFDISSNDENLYLSSWL